MTDIRIGIIGSSGTGKTSIAEAVALALGVPMLKSKEITESILKRDGYDYAMGIQIERFLSNSGRQNEILRRTIEQQSIPSFVTDRTTVDLAAYAVQELHHSDVEVLRNIVETCRKQVTTYTHLFLCPWLNAPIADSKKRTLNPWYQYLIHIIERGLLFEWECKYHTLVGLDTKSRAEEIVKIVAG